MAEAFNNTTVSRLLSVLEKYKVDTIQDVDNELTATAFEIEAEAKARAAKDKGNLAQTAEVVNKPLEKTVRFNANYAAYVEFGTGTTVDVPKGLEDYAIQFKGKGVKQVKLPARPYLFPAYFKKTKDLIKNLRNILTNAKRK